MHLGWRTTATWAQRMAVDEVIGSWTADWSAECKMCGKWATLALHCWDCGSWTCARWMGVEPARVSITRLCRCNSCTLALLRDCARPDGLTQNFEEEPQVVRYLKAPSQSLPAHPFVSRQIYHALYHHSLVERPHVLHHRTASGVREETAHVSGRLEPRTYSYITQKR